MRDVNKKTIFFRRIYPEEASFFLFYFVSGLFGVFLVFFNFPFPCLKCWNARFCPWGRGLWHKSRWGKNIYK